MSVPIVEERKPEIVQREIEKEEKKVGESSLFWKRYVERENSVEKLRDESVNSEVIEARMERISPLELESSSLLDWTFEEQFKQLYELDDDPERKSFLDDYFEFMKKRGTPVNRIPIMAKQILDLYQLYRLVVQYGGLVQVIKNKQWSKITRGLNLPASITSAAFTLRTQYLKYLYTYECMMHGFSTPKELQAAIDNNKRDRFSTFYPSQPTMTFNGDVRYPTASTFTALARPTPSHSLYEGMSMAIKRRSDVLDNRIGEKSGQESPKVVILRNGSPVYVNTDSLVKGSPSAPRQSHIDSRLGRHSPLLHEPESKRPYPMFYGRGEWDGDVRQLMLNDHKPGFTYERREHDHANVKFPYADMREFARARKVPCPCNYCLSEQSTSSQSPVVPVPMRESPPVRDNRMIRGPLHMTSPVKRETANRSPDDLVIEEKMEKDSNSSSGFEELSPNGQSGSESDRPESQQAKKITDINMRIASEGDISNGAIKISIEINGVMYKGTLESAASDNNESKVV